MIFFFRIRLPPTKNQKKEVKDEKPFPFFYFSIFLFLFFLVSLCVRMSVCDLTGFFFLFFWGGVI